jgi:hypothetical protein
MIEQLVSEAAKRTGLTADQARATLAGALALIRKHADPARAAELFKSVPGSDALAEAGSDALKTGGGLMGGLMKGLGGATGAALSDAAAMAARLSKQGVSTEAMRGLLPVAMDWVKAHTGRDLLRDVLASVPGLGKMFDR